MLRYLYKYGLMHSPIIRCYYEFTLAAFEVHYFEYMNDVLPVAGILCISLQAQSNSIKPSKQSLGNW